jgi:hypothetical protein
MEFGKLLKKIDEINKCENILEKNQFYADILSDLVRDKNNKCVYMLRMKDKTMRLKTDSEYNQKEMSELFKLNWPIDCKEIQFFK